jgi:hypothetical protein
MSRSISPMTAHAVGTGAGDLAESLDRGGVAGRTGVARAGVACARAGGAVTSEVRYRHRQGGDCLIEQRGNRLDVAGELVDLVQQEAGQPGVVVGEPTGAGGSRTCRIGSAGTKEGETIDFSPSLASHTASSLSVWAGPGRSSPARR